MISPFTVMPYRPGGNCPTNTLSSWKKPGPVKDSGTIQWKLIRTAVPAKALKSTMPTKLPVSVTTVPAVAVNMVVV